MKSKHSTTAQIAFATILLLTVFALIGGATIFRPGGQDSKSELFVSLDQNKLDLTQSQEELLQQIKSESTTAETKIVKIRTNLLKPAPQGVKLNLRANKEFEVLTTETKTMDGSLNWIGKSASPADDAILVIKDGNVTGTVRSGDELYAIRPLGGGLHVVIRQAQNRFPPDHPPEFERREKESPRELRSSGAADVSTSPKTLRVLVAYTPKVAAARPDIDSLIDLAIAETNEGYTRSQVNIRAELAYAYKVTYQESGSHDTDLANFRNNSDSLMDEVHALRDTYKADVCVLLIDNDSYCGLADAILAVESSAFAVVHYSCAVGYYSFAHEIGHLQGARHNLEADGTLTPYSYGHGYYNVTGNFRTIMSYNCPAGCPRVLHWSNPNVNYNGYPTGTDDKQYNAKVLNETAPVITAFRN